jgi:hypothetical protein
MQALRSDGTDAQSVSTTLVNMHALERMFDLSEDADRDTVSAGGLED